MITGGRLWMGYDSKKVHHLNNFHNWFKKKRRHRRQKGKGSSIRKEGNKFPLVAKGKRKKRVTGEGRLKAPLPGVLVTLLYWIIQLLNLNGTLLLNSINRNQLFIHFALWFGPNTIGRNNTNSDFRHTFSCSTPIIRLLAHLNSVFINESMPIVENPPLHASPKSSIFGTIWLGFEHSTMK